MSRLANDGKLHRSLELVGPMTTPGSRYSITNMTTVTRQNVPPLCPECISAADVETISPVSDTTATTVSGVVTSRTMITFISTYWHVRDYSTSVSAL